MTPFNDQLARERIRTSLDESLIVEAAAGTGKTSELVRRIVNVIRTGRTTINSLVAVTFTRKAAGELRLRLRFELDKAREAAGDAAEIRNLEHALSRLEEAHIGTIHAFCAELLRQRPVEARIPPEFEELDEHQSARLYNRAFDAWIQTALQTLSPTMRRALARLASNMTNDSEGGPLDRLRWDGRQLVEWRDFPAAWRREDFDRQDAVDRLIPEILDLSRIACSCADTRHPLRRHLQPLVDFAARLHRAEAARCRDYDELEALLVRLARDLRRRHAKGGKRFSAEISRDDAIAAKDRLVSNLDEFERRSGADLAASLQEEFRTLIAGYESIKTRSGKLDFVDLLIRTRNLLRGNAGVRRFMQERFTHIFVDEFQDTDPIQAEILMLLAADDPGQTDWREIRPLPGKLFMVGDPKQSIYRFRRADIIMYQDVCARLKSNGVGFEYLTRSFRAVRPIQDCINAAFAPEMTGDAVTGQPAYVPLQEFAASLDRPAIVALPAPHPYGTQRVSNDAIDKCLPSAIAGFVDWLLHESGWKVRDPLASDRLVPIQSQHIAILFRRFMSFGEDVTRDYVRGLELRNIPHVLWGARSFHQREEIETVRAALNAIERLDDDLSVYATLRGSLFAISDSLLLRYFAQDAGPAAVTADFSPVESALSLLKDLHRRRNRRSAVETVNELLEAARAHAGFALRPSGNQVLANVYRICDLARAYELSGGYSFRGFVEHLNDQAESENSVEAPVLEEGAEGVRIMTVHAAKGLEFPVVILADMTANIAQRNANKHVNAEQQLCAIRLLNCSPWDLIDHESEEHARDEAEGIRVAYVAATRARDLLVVSCVGDEEREGWLKPLNKALYPPRAQWRSAAPAPFCPEFGEATVLKRPVGFDGAAEMSVQPGLRTPGSGGHRVVWWDPAKLRLDVEPSFGLRQEDILREDPPDRAAASSVNYESWRVARAEAVRDGARPSVEVFVATDAVEPPEGYAARVRVSRVPRTGGRPGGSRFGSLVHLIMRDANYNASKESVERAARTHARLIRATDEEVSAAVEAVDACLKHPLLDLARKSRRVHREFPIVLNTEPGPLLDAVVDLTFEADSGWIVVDFKTDAEDPQRVIKYRRQVGWYVHAIEQLSRQNVTGWLLHI